MAVSSKKLLDSHSSSTGLQLSWQHAGLSGRLSPTTSEVKSVPIANRIEEWSVGTNVQGLTNSSHAAASSHVVASLQATHK